jgi:hypothetical protein
MVTAEEPVAFGLIKSLAHPGGSITGLAVVGGPEIYGKNLELLTDILPKGSRTGGSGQAHPPPAVEGRSVEYGRAQSQPPKVPRTVARPTGPRLWADCSQSLTDVNQRDR